MGTMCPQEVSRAGRSQRVLRDAGSPLRQCEGSQAGQREAVRVGLLCVKVEHIGEKSTGPISKLCLFQGTQLLRPWVQ